MSAYEELAEIATEYDPATTWEKVFDACLQDGGVHSKTSRAAVVSRVKGILLRLPSLDDAAALDSLFDELREGKGASIVHAHTYAWKRFMVAALTFGAAVADRVATPTNTALAKPLHAIAEPVARLYAALRLARWTQSNLISATWGLLSWTGEGDLLVPGYLSAARQKEDRALPMLLAPSATDDLFEIIRWGYPGRVPEGDLSRAARLRGLNDQMLKDYLLLVSKPVKFGSIAAPRQVSARAISATIRRGRVGQEATTPFGGYEAPEPGSEDDVPMEAPRTGGLPGEEVITGPAAEFIAGTDAILADWRRRRDAEERQVSDGGSSQVSGTGAAATGAAPSDDGSTNGAGSPAAPFGPPELDDLTGK